MKSSVPVFVLVFCFATSSVGSSGNFWEFLIGPRLGNRTAHHQKTLQKSTEEIVKSFGYRLDTHLVASETGHILTLHRIPRGRKVPEDSQDRPVAFIHHGLLGSSDMWLLRGPQQDLPYILADAGYDVWLFNARGNVHSRRHKFLKADQDAEYWNFGIEEIGYYDLPVSFDYILNITNQKDLFFLGHSIGSSAGFITCALHPQYNEKIRLFLALGPLTSVKHVLNPLHKIIFPLMLPLLKFTESMNIYEFMPRRDSISEILEMLCEDKSPLQKLCLQMIFSIVGDDISELNTKTFPHFMQYYPSGTSLKIMANVIQYYLSGEFARNDLGPFFNVLRYNSSSPTVYNLSKVTVPVSLHYGLGDFLVTKEDIDDLSRRLPNPVGKFEIPHKHFNHLDFVLATNSRSLLYDRLLGLMAKYR